MSAPSDFRDECIARVVKGKTFADVGGLWGTISEKVSVAHKYGAASLTMVDIQAEGNEWWQKFDDRMHQLGVTEYKCVSTDICNPSLATLLQPFEVVHCAGVLYHHPNPMVMLVALRSITKQYLILSSVITQQVIKNEKGTYTIPPSGVVFVPALNDAERAILKVYWDKIGAAFGLTEKYTYRLDDFAPWWWLPTAPALLAMCQAAGFKVLEHALIWNNDALTVLLEV
ncbi:MAG: hypothetical protein BroJett011_45880 [Chloroflexota bacterium]|nr:MAG: hypothetical protein BroJett011_45880 [Chloroflexota bacterium]